MTGAEKSELHELKQAWKAARDRWLKNLRYGENERSDLLWSAYESTRDVYFARRAALTASPTSPAEPA